MDIANKDSVQRVSELELKAVISEVNKTLSFFDPGFVYISRLMILEPEQTNTLEEYVECRLNFEMSQCIPALEPYVEMFDGKLFKVTELTYKSDKEKNKNKFELATVVLNDNPNDYFGDQDFTSTMEMVNLLLGGNTLKFNASPKRIKITVE